MRKEHEKSHLRFLIQRFTKDFYLTSYFGSTAYKNAGSLLLNGDYVKLGAFQDVKNALISLNKPIVIELSFTREKSNLFGNPMEIFTLSYELVFQESNELELIIDNIHIKLESNDFKLAEPNIQLKRIRNFSSKIAFQSSFYKKKYKSFNSKASARQLYKLIPTGIDILNKTNDKVEDYFYLGLSFNFSEIHFVSETKCLQGS